MLHYITYLCYLLTLCYLLILLTYDLCYITLLTSLTYVTYLLYFTYVLCYITYLHVTFHCLCYTNYVKYTYNNPLSWVTICVTPWHRQNMPKLKPNGCLNRVGVPALISSIIASNMLSCCHTALLWPGQVSGLVIRCYDNIILKFHMLLPMNSTKKREVHKVNPACPEQSTLTYLHY